jgi:hypothetical protein
MKMNNLVWNVYIHDFNNNKIKPYNIFYKGSIEEIKDYLNKKYTLREAITQWSKYHYWCKAEYEIQIGGLFSSLEEFQKIDIYNQIEMNIDRIVEYVRGEINGN